MVAKSPEVVGDYLVYEQLGRGGMATVHRAETQGIIKRPVALKRLLPHLAVDNDLVRSFTHEARLASKLRHANCAQTYELGKVDDTYFIAMEYVPGPTVSQLVKQCAAAAGLCPISVAIEIIVQVLDGLDHAHNLCDESGKPLGIIHRDVSPSNIIISNAGVVKLIDFGIAKAEDSGVRTQTGMIKGKFGYVAPEYTFGSLDLRADLFAVGVILHELLTGRRLFEGRDNYETIDLLRSGPIQPPSRWRPEVARVLDDIVLTALQRDPQLRWQSAAAMRAALSNFAHESKLEITKQQLVDWVEWAFSQQPIREETALARAISTLEEPSSQLEIEAETIVRPSSTVEVTFPVPKTETPVSGVEVVPASQRGAAVEGKPPPITVKAQKRSRVVPVLVALVLLAVTAYVVVDHYGYTIDWSVFG